MPEYESWRPRMKLALIGSGNMGQALVRGFLRQNKLASRDLSIYDIDQNKARCFAEETGGKSFPTAAEAVSGADIVLLAVKPLVIQAAITDFSDHLADGVILVSIAAGVSLAHLRRLTGPGPKLARIMPNTPAMIGSGVSAICFDQADRRQQQLIEDLFASCGLVVTVNEDLMDAVTGLSGSGPAYVMLMIEAMADAGVLLGLSRETAQQMAAMTLMGSAKLVLETGIHPAVLKDQVCSSGGTTIEAVASLEADGLRSALINAVCTAAAKSQQLRETAGKHD